VLSTYTAGKFDSMLFVCVQGYEEGLFRKRDVGDFVNVQCFSKGFNTPEGRRLEQGATEVSLASVSNER